MKFSVDPQFMYKVVANLREVWEVSHVTTKLGQESPLSEHTCTLASLFVSFIVLS